MSTPLLKTGSYLIRFIQNDPPPEIRWLDGTLRISRENIDGTLVEATDGTVAGTVLRASADLYARSTRPELEKLFIQSFKNIGFTYKGGRPSYSVKKDQPDIPSFPRNAYRYYLEGLEVYERLPATENVTIRFRVHQFDRTTRSFTSLGIRACILTRLPLKDIIAKRKPEKRYADPTEWEFTSHEDYFSGRVIDEATGNVVGKVRVGRLSNYLRIAEVEIDRVASVPTPTETKVMIEGKLTPVNWLDAFKGTGWKVTPRISNTTVEQPKPAEGEPYREDGAWTLSELHQAMMIWHDAMREEDRSLDSAWSYYVLCVRRLVEFERGVMFDAGGSDAEEIPHDVVAIEADWAFPYKGPWDEAKGKKFSETPAYFRTAVHELGHAMGLEHNHEDNGFMNTTDAIAADAEAKAKARAAAKAADEKPKEEFEGEPFPKNILVSFHPRDQARLRHEPDVRVRPDTSCEGAAIIQPDTEEAKPVEGLRLHLTPHLQSVPYGAPVRIQFRLENTSKKSIRVPADFSLKSGYVRGIVIDPMGNKRTFSPVVWRMDDHKFNDLEPGPDHTYSATLLRGAEGALFRIQGPHRIRLYLNWADREAQVSLSEQTMVTITPPVDDDHRISALITLATPETLLSLAVGGDHLVRGNSAIQTAINNPVLKPHYAIVEAKRLAVRYRPCEKEKSGKKIKWTEKGSREPKLDEAFALLDTQTVLAPDELYRVAMIIVRVLEAVAKRDDIKNAKSPQDFDSEVKKALEEVGLNLATVAKVSKMLEKRVERLLSFGKLHAKDWTYVEVKRLPETENKVLEFVRNLAFPN